jgi:hypothetical protein
MNIEITCQQCQRRLRVPEDLIGTLVKCPNCETIFTATEDQPEPAAPGPRPVEDEPRPGPPRESFRGEEDDRLPRRPSIRDRDVDAGEEDDRPTGRRIRSRHDYDEDYPSFGGGRQAALSQVAGPAIALLIVGIMGVLFGLFYMGLGILMPAVLMGAGPGGPGPAGGPPPVFFLAIYGGLGLLMALYNAVIVFGAVKMKNLKNFGLAMTTCILALIPLCNCWMLSIPFGIWALIVILRPEVKDSFS